MDVLVFTGRTNAKETLLIFNELKSKKVRALMKAPWDFTLPKIGVSAEIVYIANNMLHAGSTFEFINRLILLEELNKNSKEMINPFNTIFHYSKANFTTEALRHGIPQPPTMITENIEQAYDYASEIIDSGKTAVIKPIIRGQGTGVVHLTQIRSRSDLLQYLQFYSRRYGRGVYYIQEYMQNNGYDVRVFIIDGEVVARMKRSNPNDFRYNASLGGRAEVFNSAEYDELALKTAEALNLTITGVDVLPTVNHGAIVLEANCYPGFTHISRTTKIPIHKRIADYIEKILQS
jgi:RimK family alpha-L-glutamate ligase